MGLLLPIYAAGVGGGGGGGPPPAWDPSDLSLAAFLRDYAGGTWTGTASLGASGDGNHDFADPGPEPDVGAALNGHGTADFNGSDDYLQAEGDWGDYYTSSCAGYILLRADNVDDFQYVFAVGYGGPFGVRIGGTSGQVSVSVNSGTTTVFRNGLAASTWALITFRHDGANLEVGINEAPGANGGDSTAAWGSSLATTDLVALGSVEDGSYANFNGRIAEVVLRDGDIADSVFTDDIIPYINDRYGLSL